MLSRLRRIWSDPVWSKVISAGVLSAAATVWARVSAEGSVVEVVGLGVGVFLVALVAAWVWTRLSNRWSLRTELDVYAIEEFAHLPLAVVSVFNPGWRPVVVSGVEFVTKGVWSIPDVTKMATTAPAMNYVPTTDPIAKVSAQLGSVTQTLVAVTIPPGKHDFVRVRLVTDHAPFDGIGIFPFHLSVTLLVESSAARVPLKDMVVSLHGAMPLSYTGIDGVLWGMPNRGEQLMNAKQAMSIVAAGAVCPDIIRNALERASEGRTRDD